MPSTTPTSGAQPSSAGTVPARIFSTFVEHPRGIHFRGQHAQEEILLFLRRHWVTNVGWLIFSFLLLIIPVFGFPFIDIIDFIPPTIPFGYLIVGFSLWYLVTFGYMLLNFLFWFYNVNIITTERIVDVDFIYLLYNEISSTVIPNVQDVTYKRVGLFGSLFDYGNVFVQTAGPDPNIEFMFVPHPSQVSRIVTQLLQRRH